METERSRRPNASEMRPRPAALRGGSSSDWTTADGSHPEAVTAEHLKAVDEFHIGGAEATAALLDQLAIGPETRVLDVGSGIGGPARTIAARYGARVTGVDLTPDFVETARRLTETVGLKADFVVGSALDLPFATASFDLATLLHVGMNIPTSRGSSPRRRGCWCRAGPSRSST